MNVGTRGKLFYATHGFYSVESMEKKILNFGDISSYDNPDQRLYIGCTRWKNNHNQKIYEMRVSTPMEFNKKPYPVYENFIDGELVDKNWDVVCSEECSVRKKYT